jgi:hypothetical protein
VRPANDQYVSQREQIGSWIPFAELRPNLLLAQHDVIGGQVFLEIFHGAARDAAVRDRVLAHNELAGSGGLARIAELFCCGGDLIAAVEVAGELFSSTRLPLDPEAVAEIGIDVARALERIHERGLIHAALWTGAVLTGRPGHGATLLDLGIGAPIGAVLPASLAGSTTAGPENLAGDPLGPTSDVYGLGALCYSLATNRFWDRRLEACPGDVDPQLAAVLDRCLAFDPADRFATVDEAAAALDLVGGPEPIVFEAPEPFAVEVGSEIDDRGPPLTEEEAWGEHAGWFINDDAPLTDDQLIALYGYQPPLSAASRRALCVAATGAALAGTLGLAVLGAEVLG